MTEGSSENAVNTTENRDKSISPEFSEREIVNFSYNGTNLQGKIDRLFSKDGVDYANIVFKIGNMYNDIDLEVSELTKTVS